MGGNVFLAVGVLLREIILREGPWRPRISGRLVVVVTVKRLLDFCA